MFKLGNSSGLYEKLAAAIKSGDEAEMKAAWCDFEKSISDQIHADYEMLSGEKDDAVLASRGYRVLTTKEKTWYGKVIDALKSPNPKTSFISILGSDDEDDLMPSTIIEDVMRHLQADHPLLKAINMQYVGFCTKWIRNAHVGQKAYWGTITAEIEKEITSSVDVVDVKQSMLSAYAVIELGMLELGPVWLDAYLRACLYEAMLCGYEAAVISGSGVNCPVGLIRDIHSGVSFSTTDGYPEKDAIIVHDFTPETYGALVARLAVTENGENRKFEKVTMIVNLADYLTKIMPATTVQASDGTFKNNLFPFPTDVIISNEVPSSRAIIALLEEYDLFAGGDKKDSIVYDDSIKFFQNARAFRVVEYGAGRAYDNTSAILLDISDMDSSYLSVVEKAAPVHYSISLASMTNGTAKLSSKTAKAGMVVTVTPKAATGYVLDKITAASGSTPVTVTDGKFTMPEGDVTVTVTFKSGT